MVKVKKGMIQAVVALCILIMPGIVLTKDIRYKKTIDEIYDSVSQIHYARAYWLSEMAIQMEPQRMEGYIAYAYLNLAKGDYEESENRLIEALKIAGEIFEDDGQVAESISEVIYTLAKYYYNWNRTEDACELLRGVPEVFLDAQCRLFLEQLVKPVVELEKDYEIVWKDKTMEILVRDLLEIPEGAIMASQVWYMEKLEIWGTHIMSDGVEITDYDDNGYYLNGIYYTEHGDIKNFDDLVHFANLEEISINFQKKPQLEFFVEKNLTRLRRLSLIADGLNDISPLMWATGLTELNLDYNKISEFLWISRLYSLNGLSVKGNQAFMSSELLESMERMNILDVSGMKRIQMERIAELPNLTELTMGDADALWELPFCESLKKLTITIKADGMYHIERMTGLNYLNLTLTEDVDLSGLSKLGHLETLSLTLNDGVNVSLQVISKITNLKELSLYGRGFVNYRAIATNPALEKVIIPFGEDGVYEKVVKYFPWNGVVRE